MRWEQARQLVLSAHEHAQQAVEPDVVDAVRGIGIHHGSEARILLLGQAIEEIVNALSIILMDAL